MPKFLEQKLKREYPGNPRAVYGTMNNIGAMHGNKETPKGAAMQAKHEQKLHPKMAQRASMVKEAHAHLSAAVPEYGKAPARQRMMMTQHHVNLRLGKGKR